uniref:PORR domain-containing protein n=1 Tax=Brassica oleracea TaxID=3712 RepID=A0A3P6GRH1_BRAOL|nr:unnamed protein product [Brassica oleracea]
MARVECAALFARGVYKPQFRCCRVYRRLKVVWKKDTKLDEAIEQDKRYNLCARVVKEVLNEPGQVIPLRYLEKRRERLRLNFKAKSFVEMNPSLFEIYHDRIKPKSDPVQSIRPAQPEEGGKSFLELVDWKEETVRTGVPDPIRTRSRPECPGLRDWLEGDYISPYEDVSRLDQASKEMEKRTVGVFHELLSLSLLKRVPVPILDEFRRDRLRKQREQVEKDREILLAAKKQQEPEERLCD